MATRKRKPLKDMAPAVRAREKAKRAAEAKKKAEAQKGHSAAWNKGRAAHAIRTAQKSKAALAEARLARHRKSVDEKKVQVTLQTFHIIGESRYGPGTVWVPQGLVCELLGMDRKAQEVEANLYIGNSFMIMQAGHGSTAVGRQIATPNFEQHWRSGGVIFDSISGKGIIDGPGERF